jgi:hypothetical protein
LKFYNADLKELIFERFERVNIIPSRKKKSKRSKIYIKLPASAVI